MFWTLIEKTAWPMDPPAPWSAFHITVSLGGLIIAVCSAGFLFSWGHTRTHGRGKPAPGNRISPAGHAQGRGRSGPDAGAGPAGRPSRTHLAYADFDAAVLWLCGITLAAGEVYKQLFLYHIVNQNCYDWWYFPFQLCSTPMYLCLVFPLLPRGTYREAAAVYLQSFGFLGGVMALVEPSGLMHPYWTLTLHGLLWHVLLIFIACYCTVSGLSQRTGGSFLSALPLFFAFCLIAMSINIFTSGRADMFYISPYYPVTQVVFHEISMVLGIWPGIAVYLNSICVGAYFSHRLLNLLLSSPQPFRASRSGDSCCSEKRRSQGGSS